jgi:hypothetical protein
LPSPPASSNWCLVQALPLSAATRPLASPPPLASSVAATRCRYERRPPLPAREMLAPWPGPTPSSGRCCMFRAGHPASAAALSPPRRRLRPPLALEQQAAARAAARGATRPRAAARAAASCPGTWGGRWFLLRSEGRRPKLGVSLRGLEQHGQRPELGGAGTGRQHLRGWQGRVPLVPRVGSAAWRMPLAQLSSTSSSPWRWRRRRSRVRCAACARRRQGPVAGGRRGTAPGKLMIRKWLPRLAVRPRRCLP